MPATKTPVQMRQLRTQVEALVWVPPSRGIADAVELYLLLSPAGRLPVPQWSGKEVFVPVSTREVGQRAALLASSLGLQVRWGERRAGGSHAFLEVNLVLDGRGLSQLRAVLAKAMQSLEDPSVALRLAQDWAVARAVLSASVVSGSLMRRKGSGITLRTPSPERARLCLAASSTLGVAAASPPSTIKEMRHRVSFDAENGAEMIERLLRSAPALSDGSPDVVSLGLT